MSSDILHKFGIRGKGYSFRDNRLIKNLHALHVLSAIAWGGGAFSMQALGFLARSMPAGAEAAQVAYCSYFIDTWVVMPGLAGCFFTGLFYSLFTSIGFTRFAWIAYKWLITLSAGFWGLLFWSGYGDWLIQAWKGMWLDGLLIFIRACVLPENVWAGLMQTAIILSMCLISIYRPLNFKFIFRRGKEMELARRVNSARSLDNLLNKPSPHDNRQVQALYDNWLGEPLGPQSLALLHTRPRDRSAGIRKLVRSGLYKMPARKK